jgi:hypothetical protein
MVQPESNTFKRFVAATVLVAAGSLSLSACDNVRDLFPSDPATPLHGTGIPDFYPVTPSSPALTQKN